MWLCVTASAACDSGPGNLATSTGQAGEYVAGAPGAGGVPAEAALDGAGGMQAQTDLATPPEGRPESPDGLHDVLLVGNSVAGTVSFIDAYTHDNLGSVDVIPDLDEVMAEINFDLVRFIAYPIVKNAQLLHHFEPGEGDRFVDDVFVSNDGKVLFVSRSNLGDVAAFDLTTPGHPQLWRTFVSSPKADHADISPDGKRLVVSATGTGRVADVIDTATGNIIGNFDTGYYPHQNDFTEDGKYIYNSSIGNVAYNSVSHADNDMKGDRWLIKVDATTLEVVRTWIFDYGIRPNVFTPDEKYLYTQLSYLNGVIKYDLEAGVEVDRSEQPLSQFALDTYATYDEYPHDSAHHGLALSGDGKHLCDCGTVDNNVAIVDTDTMEVAHMVDVGLVPYWATTSPDGTACFVTISGEDNITVIDYASGQQIGTVPTGKFPQRSRLGRVPQEVLDGLRPEPG